MRQNVPRSEIQTDIEECLSLRGMTWLLIMFRLRRNVKDLENRLGLLGKILSGVSSSQWFEVVIDIDNEVSKATQDVCVVVDLLLRSTVKCFRFTVCTSLCIVGIHCALDTMSMFVEHDWSITDDKHSAVFDSCPWRKSRPRYSMMSWSIISPSSIDSLSSIGAKGKELCQYWEI